jgi:uncharacterized protein YbjT (DUF2867 family)
MRILVTGGTGRLGRHIVDGLLQQTEATVRIASRKAAPTQLHPHAEWVQMDLAKGWGLAEAVRDVNVIVHAATDVTHSQTTDVAGTRVLLSLAHNAGVSHVVYVSIVGIDRIPFSYYKSKLATEEVVKNAAIPWTILRATQFHYLINSFINAFARFPLIMPMPTDLRCQPVDEREVAAHLVALATGASLEYVPEMGGPEVVSGRDLARIWLTVRGMQRPIIPLWLPGKVAEGFRCGYNTCQAEYVSGTLTWEGWLRDASEHK